MLRSFPAKTRSLGLPMKKTGRIYGPVPSRRLGFSLGVDLIPFKTCPLDCIYCQLGRTTHPTIKRADYVPVPEVLGELQQVLREVPAPDFITLSGSGEPTLHSGIGEIVAGIRKMSQVPIAILTNGVLLGDKEVRDACSRADVVIPSLDAGDEAAYLRVNRPIPGLTLRSLVDGIRDFRKGFSGEVWLEVMILDGITDSDAEVKKIARYAREIRPHRIHLNTAVRPAAEESARPVSFSALDRIAGLFTPQAEIILELPPGEEGPSIPMEKVMETLERRPCTVEDIAAISGLSPVQVVKILEEMLRENKLEKTRMAGSNFYAATPVKAN